MSTDKSSRSHRLFGDSVGDFLSTLLAQEAFSGFVLLGALTLGIVWASFFSGSYNSFVTASLHIVTVPTEIVNNTETLIANLVMVVFFGAIGLEIARERAVGTLKNPKVAVAPVAAALGGMAMAAITFAIVIASNGDRSALSGWGIPMATDVAFTLGALSLLGSKVSRDLRVFLLTLAVADDVASVVVLGLTSRHGSSLSALSEILFAVLALGIPGAALLARSFAPHATVFVILTMALWWTLAHLGIEPTLAGVIIGVLVPTGSLNSVVGLRLERVVAPLSAFLILPLFAIVVGGVNLATKPWIHQGGLIVALLIARTVGKVIGIVGGVALVVRLGVGRLPQGTNWAQLTGAALLCGIGFTVPLLFAAHAFSGSPAMIAATKVGLLVASAACAVIGLLVIALKKSPRGDGHE